MSKEDIKAKDEVQFILYDSEGHVKQASSKHKKTKLEKFLDALRWILERW